MRKPSLSSPELRQIGATTMMIRSKRVASKTMEWACSECAVRNGGALGPNHSAAPVSPTA